MTPERVLELKCTAEKCIAEFNEYVKELHEAGYKVTAQPDSTLFIFRDSVSSSHDETAHTMTNTTVREYYGEIAKASRSTGPVPSQCTAEAESNGSCVRGEN